jgi:hypothetical protein
MIVIRQAAILLGVPVGCALLVAVPMGLWRGEYQWLCAAVATALTVPPGLLSLVLAERLSRTSPFGKVAAMAVGTFVRMGVGFGGGVLVLFAAGQTFRAEPVSYLSWLLGMYLITLVVEVTLLGGGSVGVGPVSGGPGAADSGTG